MGPKATQAHLRQVRASLSGVTAPALATATRQILNQ